MRDVLLFTLYAPLASWGDVAVGEARGSWDRPSRSAVLGLIAAALGIDRGDQARHDALDAGYGVAVRLDAPGAPLVDYHTAQTAAATEVQARRPATRAELLDLPAPRLQTILSRRSYRQNALATVALWEQARAASASDDAARAPALPTMAEALARPHFTLYAGRKCNALGLPLAPRVVAVATLADAFARRTAEDDGRRAALGLTRLRPRQDGWGREVAHDPCDREFAIGLEPLRREVRRDGGAHRGRWQFAERVVEVVRLPEAVPDVPRQGGAL